MNETAQEKGLKTININSLTEQNPQWFEKDGVHPNNDVAYGIAAQIKKALEN
ncbi:MAG: hypothetical protein LIO43_02230 [Clostridiales bacterium]|nr:hypothetical protein [Clostridiales bacterium]